MTKISDEHPTVLKEALIEKVKDIKENNINLQYFPERVEPGIKYDLKQVDKWSRFAGKTLYINDNFLSDPQLQDSIMFREALLLFAPREMREYWWIQLLANSYPLVIKQTKAKIEAWLPFWKMAIETANKRINVLTFEKLVRATDQNNLINIFQECLYREVFEQEHQKKNKRQNKGQLTLEDFYLIHTKVYRNSSTLSETDFEILELALKYQTIKISELEEYSERHRNTIWNKIKRLKEIRVLFASQSINYQALNLIPFIVVLLASKSHAKLFFKEHPKSPFLHSQKINNYANNTITQYYLAPDSKDFKEGLLNYCQSLQEKEEIYNYYILKNQQKNAFRSYNFTDYNKDFNEHRINIHSLFIACNNSNNLLKNFRKNDGFGNVFVKSPQQAIEKTPKLEEIDFGILNSFLKQRRENTQPTRNEIREELNKDLNEIVDHIHALEEQEILYEEVIAIPSDCTGQLTLYSEILEEKDGQEKSPNKKKEDLDVVSLKDKVKVITKLLPHCYYSELVQPEGIDKHSFQGIFLQTYLPSHCLTNFADFLNWFIPFSEGVSLSEVSRLLLVGQPIFQKVQFSLEFNRWNNGKWLIKEEDFEHVQTKRVYR